MSEFTFETKNRTHKYETYEWDNTWIDHPNDDVKRVLYVGDSISCGIRGFATEKADGKVVFDLFGTSRAIDNPYFKDALTVFANQEERRDVIIFNNGLHGWHIEDETEFKQHYEDMIKFILEKFNGTPLAIALSTYVNGEDLSRVISRNKVMCELAEKYNLTVIDLFSVSEKAKEYLHVDGVHFSTGGYQILAEKIVGVVSEILK